jgi:hypothetical protein
LARAIAAVTCALALLAGRAALGAPERAESMAIETFSAYPVGGFPKGWKVRGSMRDAQSIYRIAEESGGRFLAARADRQSIMIGLERPFEPSRYPYLRWRWRVRQCPTGADERRKSTNDSAAGVYVVFPGRFFMPRVLKYVWSSTLPIGTRQASPVASSTKIIVLESGTAGEPAWRTVTVNVQRDYAALFGEPAPTARGIGILTDSNDTSSVAAADYADFQLLGAEDLPPGTARTHTPGAPPTTR